MDTYFSIWVTIGVLLVGSAFFSSAETSIFSLGRVQLQNLKRKVSSVYKVVDFLVKRPRRTLVTILLGNEVMNLSISVLMTAFYAKIFPGESWQKITLFTLATSTPLILMFGEITPKTLAVRFPISFVQKNSFILRVIYFLVTPIRKVILIIAGNLINLFAGKPDTKSTVLTEADLKILVEEGTEAGTIGEEEQKLIFNVLHFSDAVVSKIMTPFEKVFSLSSSLSIDDIITEIKKYPYSRIPIYKEHKDKIIGILHSKELLRFSADKNPPKNIASLLIEPLRISPNLDLESAFREFRATRVHMAIVVNEEFTPVGIVTMDDLLEELFGTLAQEKRGGNDVG